MADKELKIKLSMKSREAVKKTTTLDRLLAKTKDLGGKAAKGLSKINTAVKAKAAKTIDSLNKKLEGTVGKLGKIGKVAAVALIAGTVAGGTLAAKKIVELGVKAEQTRLSFQTMMGDTAKGNAMLGMLNEMANITPFSNDEVVTAGKTLLSFGIQAKNVRDNLKMIGDVSAGTGKSFTELTAIFGKAFAKGKADSETLNQMSEAGIPIVKTLGEMYGKTGEEIYKMASNGEISAQSIQGSFKKMTEEGGIFADMMGKQSETVGGLWSTVTGKLEYFGATLGEQVMPLLKIGLKYIMGWVDELLAMARDGRAIQYLSAVGMTGVIAIGNIIKSYNSMREYGAYAWTTIGRIGSIAIESLQAVVAGAIVAMVDGSLAGINFIIDAMNEIPGIDLDTVQSPEWVEKMRQWRDMSAEQVKADVKGLFGGDLAKAESNIKTKNAAVDKTVDAMLAKIGKWQADTQDTITRRKLDEKQYEGELKGGKLGDAIGKAAAKAIDTSNTAKPERLKFDRLTKMRLYNFGTTANPIKSIDIERNSLLKQILSAARDKNTTTVLA
ncbi:MAG: tape measure protein [Victivallaceae bacterium]|nr:tape measure protein [Victivallaceae bacterium]